MPIRTSSALGATVLAAIALGSCSSGTTTPSRSAAVSSVGRSSTPKTTPKPTPSTKPTHRATSSTATTKAPSGSAQRAFDAMTERERVGQLLMVDCSTTGVSQATTTAITQYHVGSVILDGSSTAGLQATRNVTAALRDVEPKGAGLFVATDQEGGLVQRLQGSGFSSIPSALTQGGMAPGALQDDAKLWGNELVRAGVNVNLAPVLDTVPANFGSNPPIGDLDREYGHTPSAVAAHGLAVVRGMTAAGVDVTVKHFPGLGRTSGNTDTSSGVTDNVTTRHDPYLAPFGAAIQAHVPFVMISTAIYARIDPSGPAAFSKTIITGMLRQDLGFGGLIISDDVGVARQVSGFSVGQRAVAFVAAGGDVVLTVDATQAADMTAALLQKANGDAAFKKQVDAAALLVLQAKQAHHLLG